MNDSIKVAIVDKDDLFRQRVGPLLEDAVGITVVGEAKDGPGAIALINKTDPDVTMLDLDTLYAGNRQVVAQIWELFAHTRVIVLHEKGQERRVLDALGKGALGHLVKGEAGPAQILEAIRAVSRGKAFLSPGVAGCMLDKVTHKRKGAKDKRAGPAWGERK